MSPAPPHARQAEPCSHHRAHNSVHCAQYAHCKLYITSLAALGADICSHHQAWLLLHTAIPPALSPSPAPPRARQGELCGHHRAHNRVHCAQYAHCKLYITSLAALGADICSHHHLVAAPHSDPPRALPVAFTLPVVLFSISKLHDVDRGERHADVDAKNVTLRHRQPENPERHRNATLSAR